MERLTRHLSATEYAAEDKKTDGPTVLIIAGIHGDEYEPILALDYLFSKLTGKLIKGRIIGVPIANEAAYLLGTRCGQDGLDMARVFPGTTDGTQTEYAAHQLGTWIAKSDFLIDMHTGGLTYDIYPMVGYMIHPKQDVLERQRAMAQATVFPLIWGTDHRPNGRTLSMARDYNIPAVYFEQGGGTGFRHDVVAIYQRSVIRILAHLGMVDRGDESDGNPLYWIEDHRFDSGHFQIKMPAPAKGIFMAEVCVGDGVEAGQRIGEIFDPLTGDRKEIKAELTGLIHFLRVMVKVNEGDALGGILSVKAHKREVIHD